jgi:predicted acyl esterase
MRIPVLTITGHYDDDQVGALHYYRHHRRYSSAREQHLLVIGPWDHGGTRTPRSSFDGLTFAEQSVIDLVDLHAQWYDWVLGRGPRPTFLQDQVTYYEAGSETWRSARSLEEMGTVPRHLYLTPNNEPADALHSAGLLDADPPSETSVVRMRSDPASAASPSRSEPSPDSLFAGLEPLQQTEGDGLVYLTTPTGADIQVTGHIAFSATDAYEEDGPAWLSMRSSLSVTCVVRDLWSAICRTW